MLPTKKITILLFIFVFFSAKKASIYGQGSASIKDNDLDNSRNLSIGGTILGVDLYDPNLNMFIEGKLCYRLKKENGWLKANYSLAYADRLEEITESSSSQEAIPAEGTKPLKTYGLSIGYNFIKRQDFQVTKATFLRRSSVKSIKLPVKSLRLYGIHIGLEYFRSIKAQGSTISYTGTINANFPKDTSIITGNATPMFSMNMISIGFHRQYVEHNVIQVNSSGTLTEYKTKYTSTFYADFLIGTKMVFEDILIPLNGNGPNSNPSNNNYSNTPYNFYRADINNSYKKIPVGGRIGWEKTGLGPVGSIVGWEFGFRPGIISPADNLYIMIKVGLSFNMKAK
jgi:hypothetical protein